MCRLDRFIHGAENLYKLLDHTAKPIVTVLGSFNSGKSTLVNGLLGADVSPVGVIPTTNCLLSFNYGQSFSAGYSGNKQNFSFQHTDQLRSFLGGLKTPVGRVDIEYPSPLLQRCYLVDTPGIDGSREAELLALKAAIEADQVIYLFHQRGIEDLNRLFIYKLAEIWGRKDLNKLSFWLNCNHGLCDGSSLEATRTALKEIFLSPVRCNTINTRDPASLGVISLLLQVELARDTCRRALKDLKKLDHELPGRISKAAGIKEESAFLCEFWRAQEASRIILETGQLLQSLPAVSGELENTLRNANLANLTNGNKKSGGVRRRLKTTGITAIQKILLDITDDLINENPIAGLTNLSGIKRIAREIRAEHFTVAILGGFSTGKTTFFNALLQDDLLPTADGPTTTAVTRITYGPNKKATVRFPLQITLRICEQVGEKVGIYREQLQALERWLAPGSDMVTSVECAAGGPFQRLGRHEFLEQVQRLKGYFAAGAFARTATNSRIPGVFKLISQKAAKRYSVLEEVRITFKNPCLYEFNLAERSERDKFKKTLDAENAFRIDQVVVEHPAEILRFADFLDTPGLDWIQKHHYGKTSGLIKESDAYLIFLNGKHILNQMDRQNFQALFPAQLGDSFETLTIREKGKYFFVINFADVLTLAERETVCNFLRRNLGVSNGMYAPAPGGPQIFLISALKALSGDDLQSMGALLKALEEGILKYRAKDFYLGKITALLELLNEALHRAAETYLERNVTGNRKIHLRKAQETLRDYRRRLKEIRSLISLNKPP